MVVCHSHGLAYHVGDGVVAGSCTLCWRRSRLAVAGPCIPCWGGTIVGLVHGRLAVLGSCVPC